jgi:hypothetical protein
MLSMVRAATSEPEAARLVRDFLARNVVQPIAERLGADDVEYRAGLVMSQIVGITIARYIVALEPSATRTREQLAADLAVTFQRYLLGDVNAPCDGLSQIYPDSE